MDTVKQTDFEMPFILGGILCATGYLVKGKNKPGHGFTKFADTFSGSPSLTAKNA